MSKVKHRDRKQKTTARTDQDVRGNKAATIEMQGDVASLTPTSAAPSSPTARKKERRYGHN
jgi:hypothetical protein